VGSGAVSIGAGRFLASGRKRYLKTRLNVKRNYFVMILKLFQCFISHVTTPETEIKLFQLLKEYWNYFKIISATLNMFENIHELQ